MFVILAIGFVVLFVAAGILTHLFCKRRVAIMVEMIFFSVLTCAGLCLVGFTVYAKVWEEQTKKGALFTTATVLSIDTSYIETKQGLKDYESERRYYTEVTYRYEVDGISYTGTTPGRDQALALLGGYKVGGTVEVYYLPDDPGNATVARNMNIGMIQNLAVGLTMVIFMPQRLIALAKQYKVAPKKSVGPSKGAQIHSTLKTHRKIRKKHKNAHNTKFKMNR